MSVQARFLLLFTMAAVVTAPVQAASSPPKPVIASAVTDIDTGTLLLRGFNFPAEPKVYMGKEGGGMDLLRVVNSSGTTIEAVLKTTAPGKYLIAVLDRGADVTEDSPFVPQSLPASSPVFTDVLTYAVRLK